MTGRGSGFLDQLKRVDDELLGSATLRETAGGSRLFGVPTATGFCQKYRFGDRLVDVESVSIQTLADVAGSLDRLDLVEYESPVALAEIRRARFVLAFPPS